MLLFCYYSMHNRIRGAWFQVREPEYRSARAQPHFPFQRPLHSVTGGSVLRVLRTAGPPEKETRGVSPQEQLAWMVSHLSHYFCIKRDADMLESLLHNLNAFKKHKGKREFLRTEDHFWYCPQTFGRTHSASPAIVDTLEKNLKYCITW